MSKQPAPSKDSKQIPVFPVGPAGKRELRRALVRSTDPATTIAQFQQSHSLHSMMARAFETVPSHASGKTRGSEQTQTVESLDTDSVLTFLNHLGVAQFEVHKRISDRLLKQLEEEIRSGSKESLLELLNSCRMYATTMPELRPVVWAVLKQLGAETPQAVLLALTERDDTGALKHAEIFDPLPGSLKRLCWEADWDARMADSEKTAALEVLYSTLIGETVKPVIQEYCENAQLVDAANHGFVATARERRVLTKQRRALTSTSISPPSSTPNKLRSSTGTSTAAAVVTPNDSGKAVAKLRSLVCDTVGTSVTVRPKLLYALLSILMAQHGNGGDRSLGGPSSLQCTLVADILLSAGGPLPKAYQQVHTLARLLDECVQNGNLEDSVVVQIQATLRKILELDTDESENAPKSDPTTVDAATISVKRQLNRIITAGLNAMKEADPQHLFLNPVTDAIAPGYSKVISKPMSIVTMERKVDKNEYNTVVEWEDDVKLVFKNCITYNRGSAGQWFRGEANRQGKVFREEIFPQARRLYQNELAKRVVAEDPANRKRRGGDEGSQIHPLPAATKKPKKEKEEYTPSMPALGTMLLADPFVVRLFLARVLRELRRGVMNGATIPAAHSLVPSLLQLLHLASMSRHIAAVRGKRYFIPESGLGDRSESEDPLAILPYATLRRYIPLLLRLFLESEIDRRVATGGDLHAAAQTGSIQAVPLLERLWKAPDKADVSVALIEGALVFISQPGMGNEASLSLTFPKFAMALGQLSRHLCDEQSFFFCLTQALLRHKAKLPKITRDSVVSSWLLWLKSDRSGKSVTSSAHQYLAHLLVEWSALGNLLLPRDTLIQFSLDTIKAVNSTASDDESFGQTWKSSPPAFGPVKKQYERLLKLLPPAQAEQWKLDTGIVASENVDEDPAAMVDKGQAAEPVLDSLAMDIDKPLPNEL